MINIDGSDILFILADIWDRMHDIIITFFEYEFSLWDFGVAMIFANLVLDFMLPFWFASLEQRALKNHYKGAYEWD